jgi:transposase
MTLNRSHRRVHSPDFKAQVIGECRRPGASIAAVAISHGLNPNVVRKWLAGNSCKRMGAAVAASPPRPSPPPDIRLELEHGGLRLNLQCSARLAPSYARLLRALADTVLCA